MNNRPRCRDWTALATQQLRLRNLIQISGHNIECAHKSSLYYTLHLTSMSAPFYTSDKLESPKNAIWPEINCQAIVKSTAHSVCIRVWQQSNSVDRQQSLDKTEAALSANKTDDKMLFLWGVYFSGLVPITKRTDVKLRENALVFHIHGGFFTAADCLLPESVPMQLESIGLLDTQRRAMATFAPVTENCDQIVLGRNSIMNLEVAIKDSNAASSNNDKGKTDAKSQNVMHFSQNSAPLKPTLPLQDDPNLLKVRYIEMNFFKSEIRRSYNISELLLLQEKQRLIRNKTESAKEIMEKICMKSAFCLNLELIANKAMLYRPRGNPSMGRTLNRLLFAQTEQPKPEVLLQAQNIRRKIETARFRCRMLVQERNQAQVNIRKLEQTLGKISDANIEQESWLMANYRGLSKEKEVAVETTDSMRRQQLLLIRSKESLHQRRQQLLRELKEIYCIERDADKHMFRINGAILPSAESFGDVATPSDISVALGYAAHLTLMCSAIMNAPLRNPIAHKGSQSKIRDNVKVMPDQDREFPLYCRSSPLPEPMRYAVFLLNQNIGQLKLMNGLNKADPRETLLNLLQLLNGTRQAIPLLVSSSPLHGNGTHQPLRHPDGPLLQLANHHSSSLSSMDLSVMVPGNLRKNDDDENNTNGDQRISRSVGSYKDLTVSVKSHFGSEPNLSAGRKQVLSTFTDNGNI